MTATEFFNGPILLWSPPVVSMALCILAVLFYFGWLPFFAVRFSRHQKFYRALAMIMIAFRVCYAGLLTVLQYLLWSGGALSRVLLGSPLVLPDHVDVVPRWLAWIFQNSGGYFFYYAWARFWLSAILAIGGAFMWCLFLRFLARHKERFFDEGEVMLGFLSALLVGWPRITIFVPLLFFCVVFLSLVRRIVWGYRYTTLGAPFLLSAFLTILFGTTLLALTGLSVLNV